MSRSKKPWYGDTPSKWQRKKIKYYMKIKNGKEILTEVTQGENAINVYGSGGVFKWTDEYLYKGESVLFGRKGTIGKPLFVNEAFWAVDTMYYTSFQENAYPKYFYYLMIIFPWDIITTQTALPSIVGSDIENFDCSVPGHSVQKRIADYLDFKISKINDLISDKENLISLLEEKRQSTITEAVIKGLNPNVEMKDSGIKWLGQVPKHWVITSLKNFWTVIDCKHVTAEFVDEGIPVASIRETQGRFINLNNAKKTTNFYYDQLIQGGRKPIPGDLIFSRNATVGEVAQVASWHPAFAVGQDVCIIRKNKVDFSSDFLQYIIHSRVVTEQLENLMVGATFKRVNVEDIRNLVIPMPPSEEQASISSFLENKIGRIDALITEVYNTVNLLKEYRQSLTYEVVTGKIDVREFEVVPK